MILIEYTFNLINIWFFWTEVCNVFLKDKSARFDHCHTDEHLNKFNAAEEERLKKEETEKKGSDNQTNATEDQNKANESSTETSVEKSSQQQLENGDKTPVIETKTEPQTNPETKEVPEKAAEEQPKESTEQSEG